MIAQAILVTGLILAALLPLLVTAYALRRLPDPGPSDTLLAETLIENLDAGLRLGPSAPPAPRRIPMHHGWVVLTHPRKRVEPWALI